MEIPDDADEIVTAKIADVQTQYIMIFTSLGQCIRFELEKTRDQGRSTRGVRGIKFKIDTDFVVDADVIDSEEQDPICFISDYSRSNSLYR